MLLPPAERRRVQALCAWTLTLFDFAHQPGLEGDRLALINSWEFSLEEALTETPPAQPVFVMMAGEEKARAWNRDGLDHIVDVARSEAVGRPPQPRALASAILETLWDRPAENLADNEAVALFESILAPAAGADSAPTVPAKSRDVPRAWRAAAGYARRVALAKHTSPPGNKRAIGLAKRLRFLGAARFFG